MSRGCLSGVGDILSSRSVALTVLLLVQSGPPEEFSFLLSYLHNFDRGARSASSVLVERCALALPGERLAHSGFVLWFLGCPRKLPGQGCPLYLPPRSSLGVSEICGRLERSAHAVASWEGGLSLMALHPLCLDRVSSIFKLYRIQGLTASVLP
ncbi:hypothetical protein A2U01_0012926 [Trifolium medium]|uniref:Uncharacterized protein n=1 Tax=Trifolium medium TaxID=97028 RepID=A0A392N0G9_9FABA|nr:hypothetical protein [Trifolium medium]